MFPDEISLPTSILTQMIASPLPVYVVNSLHAVQCNTVADP